jgi:hypothetical protein
VLHSLTQSVSLHSHVGCISFKTCRSVSASLYNILNLQRRWPNIHRRQGKTEGKFSRVSHVVHSYTQQQFP